VRAGVHARDVDLSEMAPKDLHFEYVVYPLCEQVFWKRTFYPFISHEVSFFKSSSPIDTHRDSNSTSHLESNELSTHKSKPSINQITNKAAPCRL
jgi:hypothetical protein